MINKPKYQLGILAFGSLIDDPGQEISEIEIDRIECETPFNVEFARISKTRGNAPTLIPVLRGGRTVKAKIIILRADTNIEKAMSILWRREVRKNNTTETYSHPVHPGPNTVVVKTLINYLNVQTVLYTSIGSNISQELTGDLLADYAIQSILSTAGHEEKDGLRYLLSIKRNNINTALSDVYEKCILRKTGTENLEQAIKKLDTQRRMYPKTKLL